MVILIMVRKTNLWTDDTLLRKQGKKEKVFGEFDLLNTTLNIKD
jgi:hypothetical protein